MEETIAPDAILPTIVGMVREALKLPYAAIALHHNGLTTITATSGTPGETSLRLPLIAGREEVGELLLAPRAPGEAFGPADQRLLADLARQIGVAAQAVLLHEQTSRLNADLQASRERRADDARGGAPPPAPRPPTTRPGARLPHAEARCGRRPARPRPRRRPCHHAGPRAQGGPPASATSTLWSMPCGPRARRTRPRRPRCCSPRSYGPAAPHRHRSASRCHPLGAWKSPRFHIAQEALTNVVKHAQRGQRLRHPPRLLGSGDLRMEVTDDGQEYRPGDAVAALLSLRCAARRGVGRLVPPSGQWLLVATRQYDTLQPEHSALATASPATPAAALAVED
ncbi:MAG: hypothetical protein U0232_25590 [Thermomicrobiales bacterium]